MSEIHEEWRKRLAGEREYGTVILTAELTVDPYDISVSAERHETYDEYREAAFASLERTCYEENIAHVASVESARVEPNDDGGDYVWIKRRAGAEPIQYLATGPGHYGYGSHPDIAMHRLRSTGYRTGSHCLIEIVPPLEPGGLEVSPTYGPSLPTDRSIRIIEDTRDPARIAATPNPFPDLTLITEPAD